MESLFEQLLPELASLIGDYLDLASLRSVRLVSKSCETKFSHAFSRSLEIQNIDLTEAGLKRLNDLASSSGLKPGVRTLRLTCLHHRRHRADEEINARLERTQPADAYPIPIMDLPSPEEMAHYELWAKDKHDVEAFADGSSMCKLLSHVLSNFESLDEISLDALTFSTPEARRTKPEDQYILDWRKLWAQAIQAFRIVMSAIARSRISLDSLAIYRDTKKCSIPTNEVAGQLFTKLQEEGFATVANGLKRFSISLATTVVPVRSPAELQLGSSEFYEQFNIGRGRKLDPEDPELANADFEAVACLLRTMPNLESLDIHLYQTTTAAITLPRKLPYQRLIKSVFSNWAFPQLKSLALRGVPLTTETMTTILSQHQQLRFLCLQNVFLVDGSWDRVLAAAIQICPSLAHAHLSNLWRPDGGGITGLGSFTITLEHPDQLDPIIAFRCFDLEVGYYVWHTRDIERSELIELVTSDIDYAGATVDVNDPEVVYLARPGLNWFPGFMWLKSYKEQCGPP